MFSGRIAEVGTVIEPGPRLVVEAHKTAGGLVVGGSVCVSGTGLSAVEVDQTWFRTELALASSDRYCAGGSMFRPEARGVVWLERSRSA
jgi:riboflavin synthase alpha subunit